MKYLTPTLLLISTIKNAAAQSGTEICVPGGRCLQLFVEDTTWDAAYDSCKSKGESLATIDSIEENNALRFSGLCSNYIAFNIRQYSGPGSPWMTKDNDGNLNQYPSYTNWDNNQPEHNTEHCVALSRGWNGWHDISCGTPYSCYTCATNASGGGDPHFSAFGGVLFTWQGHCEAVLTKIPATKTKNIGIDIHIRTTKVRKWSSIEVIAMKVGQDVLEVRSDDGNLFLNGTAVKTVEKDSLSVKKSMVKSKKKTFIYEFVFEGDKKLQVKVNTRTRMIFVSLSGNYPKETVGLLGSPHHPGMFARDGTNMTEQDVNAFAESWQVRDIDPQLFIIPREPTYPAKCLYSMEEIKTDLRSSRRLKEIRKASMVEAIAACAAHHPGPLKAFCIEDMIETGDFDSAQDEFYG